MGRSFFGAFSACILVFLSASVCAGDLSAGKKKAEVFCQTCHGMDGIGTIAGVPNLSGQKEDYMKIQLEAYRAGKRQHLQMSTIAQTLSDQDIRDVSRWYSSIAITIIMPEQ